MSANPKLFSQWQEVRNLPEYIAAKEVRADGQYLVVQLSQTIEEEDKSWEDVYYESALRDGQGGWTFFELRATEFGKAQEPPKPRPKSGWELLAESAKEDARILRERGVE